MIDFQAEPRPSGFAASKESLTKITERAGRYLKNKGYSPISLMQNHPPAK